MTNSITEILRDQFVPQLLLSVYKSENTREYYIESHDIIDGKPTAGKPLQTETIAEILDAMYSDQQEQQRMTGLFPDNLLAYEQRSGGKYMMCWYRPEELRKLFFAPQLKIPNGKAMVPPMVYLVDDGDLRVFALQANDRPGPKTPLYRAPFFNVDDDGNVCLGDAKVQKPQKMTFAAVMKYWEDLFWLSKFTHQNGDNAVQSLDINELWKTLIVAGASATWLNYDQLFSVANQLIKTNQTIEDII